MQDLKFMLPDMGLHKKKTIIRKAVIKKMPQIRMIVIGFAAMILIGTLLLMLPAAYRGADDSTIMPSADYVIRPKEHLIVLSENKNLEHLMKRIP